MSDGKRISDELRKMADERFIGIANTRVHDLANRIDAEMVELPRDKDGVPVHLNDTVYDSLGKKWHVNLMTLYSNGNATVRVGDGVCSTAMMTDVLTHERHDSLERIVSDMGAEIESMESSITASDDALDALRDYMDRIKAFAEAEGGQR